MSRRRGSTLEPQNGEAAIRRGNLYIGLFLCAWICMIAGCASKEKQAENHFRKGFEYQNDGNPQKAIDEYQEALELSPNYVQVYTNLGTVYLGMKDYDRAIQNFNKVIELNYWDKKAHYNLGMAYLYQGDVERAKAEVEFLKSINSDMGKTLERKIAERESTP